MLRALPNRAPCLEFNSSADEGPRHEKSRWLCAHGDLEAHMLEGIAPCTTGRCGNGKPALGRSAASYHIVSYCIISYDNHVCRILLSSYRIASWSCCIVSYGILRYSNHILSFASRLLSCLLHCLLYCPCYSLVELLGPIVPVIPVWSC